MKKFSISLLFKFFYMTLLIEEKKEKKMYLNFPFLYLKMSEYGSVGTG